MVEITICPPLRRGRNSSRFGCTSNLSLLGRTWPLNLNTVVPRTLYPCPSQVLLFPGGGTYKGPTHNVQAAKTTEWQSRRIAGGQKNILGMVAIAPPECVIELYELSKTSRGRFPNHTTRRWTFAVIPRCEDKSSPFVDAVAAAGSSPRRSQPQPYVQAPDSTIFLEPRQEPHGIANPMISARIGLGEMVAQTRVPHEVRHLYAPRKEVDGCCVGSSRTPPLPAQLR